MTVGLVGFGAIGRAVARLLLNFGATVLYYDPVQASSAVESELQVTRRPLDELLAASDLVSLHLPLMKETAGLIDAPRIAAMKRGAILVNCARGGLVDEAALHRALVRSEEHTSELQSLMRISYAVFCLKKKKRTKL